jgi:hypothetical protein
MRVRLGWAHRRFKHSFIGGSTAILQFYILIDVISNAIQLLSPLREMVLVGLELRALLFQD